MCGLLTIEYAAHTSIGRDGLGQAEFPNRTASHSRQILKAFLSRLSLHKRTDLYFSSFVNSRYQAVPVDKPLGISNATIKVVHFERPEHKPTKKASRTHSYVRAVKSAELPSSKDEDMKPKDSEEIELIETTTTNLQRNGEPVDKCTTSCGKKIDFVLVYSKHKDEEQENNDEKKRNYFERHLKEEKLQLEFTDGTSSACGEKGFVLVHAPWDVLCKYAEEMMIRVPIRCMVDDEEPELSNTESILKWFNPLLHPFRLKTTNPQDQKKYITAFFSQDKMKNFMICDEDTFSDNDRCRIVNFILHKTKYSNSADEFGISRLLHETVYTDAFRLHDSAPNEAEDETAQKNTRQRLSNEWASFNRWYKFQPLNAIKNYFGIRVALYFAWLGTYNQMLIAASIVGLMCFISGLVTLSDFLPAKEICDKNNSNTFYMCPLCDKYCSFWTLTKSCDYAQITHLFDHEGTVFFAIFMSLWATVFLEVWKRRQISLAYEWDMMQFSEEYQPPRPEFVAKVKSTWRNPITRRIEPHLPRPVRLRRTTFSCSIIALMILLVIATVLGVVLYRAAVVATLSASPHEDVRGRARIVTSLTASALNLVFITLLSTVYAKLAVILTNWENPRTASEYQDDLTIKMFLFEFVNTYSSLFYIAFFKSSLVIGTPGNYTRISGGRLDACDPSGCLIELCIQLAVIMIGKQLYYGITKFAIPSLTLWWSRQSSKKSRDCDQTAQDDPVPVWERDYLLNAEPQFRMFYEYLDMVIQFGFVTMFVAAFPLAPVFALINNIFEMRIDAINFVTNFRRPVPQRAQTIGVWYDIILAVSKLSVLVNSFVIGFTSEFIPREVYKYAFSPDGTLTGYVNNSLSYFNVADIRPGTEPNDPFKNLPYNNSFCRYKEYFEPVKPYNFNRQFYYVTTVRLVFVFVFQYFVFFTVGLLAWIIPDVPRSLDNRIKREDYIARQCLTRSEAVTASEFGLDESGDPELTSLNSVYVSCDNIPHKGKAHAQ